MGISATYYSNILAENGEGNLRIEHLENLLKTHNVNPAWVLAGVGEMFMDPVKAGNEWISGNIVPDLPLNIQVDRELLEFLVQSVVKESGLPIIYSDLGYSVALWFGKYYMGKNPHATRDSLDIPVLTAAFLALLQTAQTVVSSVVELEGKATIRLGEQTHIYERQTPPAR